MEPSSLYELISTLEYGTNLHIGVLFFGKYGNELLNAKHEHTIHSSPICDAFKSKGKHGFERCFACRNLAINKARICKKAFGGLCINGVYEYTYPILIDKTVTGIIFVGNILTNEGLKIINSQSPVNKFLNTMQKDFCEQQCNTVCRVIESYIKMIFETQPMTYLGTDALIENIKTYLKSNLEYNINATQLSRVFGYNKKYLGRLFKSKTGMTVKEYENQKRIKLAKKLIADNNLSLMQIAIKTGFSDIAYFNTVFKDICGISPGKYRESLKG